MGEEEEEEEEGELERAMKVVPFETSRRERSLDSGNDQPVIERVDSQTAKSEEKSSTEGFQGEMVQEEEEGGREEEGDCSISRKSQSVKGSCLTKASSSPLSSRLPSETEKEKAVVESTSWLKVEAATKFEV